jgi:hypothetical protein
MGQAAFGVEQRLGRCGGRWSLAAQRPGAAEKQRPDGTISLAMKSKKARTLGRLRRSGWVRIQKPSVSAGSGSTTRTRSVGSPMWHGSGDSPKPD